MNISYDDNLTPARQFCYDQQCAGWSPTVSNAKCRLVYTGTNLNGNSATWAGSLYSYDAMGRVLNIWQCAPSTCVNSNYAFRSVWYNYDFLGNVTLEGDTASGAIGYGRSVAGELTSVTNQTYTLAGAPGTSTLMSNAQNGAAGPVSYSLGNGLSQYNSYDTLNRLNGSWVCSGSPSANCSPRLSGYSLTWSGTNLQASSQDNIGSGTTYQYDDFNRLSQMKNSAGQATYNWVYDRYGNRWQQNALQGGSSFNQTFTAATNRLGGSGYAYDAAGNMTNDGFHSYTYDAEGNILQADGGQTGTYVYDALGRRARSQLAMWSGGYVENVYDAAGRITSGWNTPTGALAGNIYADGMQIAFRSGDGKTYFNHKDWLDTDRVHTDTAAAVAAAYTSLPFGDGANDTVNEDYGGWDFHRFAGQDYNQETDTYRATFRQYSAVQGRWLSPDPYDGRYDAGNPQSFNRYAYVLNNPMRYVDPKGLDCVYFNDAGDGVESVDRASNSGDCGSTGGDWVNGIYAGARYNAGNDTFNIQSTSAAYNYNTTASAPGSQSDGTGCYGNCDTETGYNQSLEWPNFTLQLGVAAGTTQSLFSVSLFTGVIVDSHGHIGGYYGHGLGLGAGEGADAGVQAGYSSSNHICGYAGPFGDANVSGGVLGGGAVDVFAGPGPGPGGMVSGGTLTGGLGGGAGGSVQRTLTTVLPFTGKPCD